MGSVREALKSAIIAAVVTLGLAFPIVALKTEPDDHNHIILVQRWGLVAVLCAFAFAGSLLRSFLKARATPDAKPRRAFPADPKRRQIIARVGLALLIAYPFIAVALAGTSGSIKWIENFGVQILLYILLAWGLNIVVGLAGLLDLGYVAFYAVGAYSLRPPHQDVRAVVLDDAADRGNTCGPLGAHHRPSGAAAAGRLPRHRDAGVCRDRASRHHQLGARSRAAMRASRTSRSHRCSVSRSRPVPTISRQLSDCPPRRSIAFSSCSIWPSRSRSSPTG